MTSFLTLIRRTSAALGAIAAMTLTGNATAQGTISLSNGGSCLYSSMTVQPNGNVSVTCGTATTSYSVTAPSSLPANTTTTDQVKVTRTGSTTDPKDVDFSLTGPCTVPGGATSGSVNILSGSSSSNLVLETGAAGATKCVVTLAPISGSSVGSPASISIVDPNADVTFTFATSSSSASVGSGAISIRVNRGGGTNGKFTVPLTLSGTLAPGGALLSGNLSAASLTFNASDSFKTFTYTPPPTTPATPSLPAQLQITFGTVVGDAGNAAGQTGSGSGSHTLSLDGPGVGCPAPISSSTMGSVNTPFVLAMPNGDIKSYKLPTPSLNSGIVKLSSTSSSNPVAPWFYEVHINKCPGLVQPPPTGVKDTCYGSYANATAVFSKYWFRKETATWTQAKIKTNGYCWAPEAEGQWYVNIRYNYAGCSTGVCGWTVQWTSYSQ